MTPDPTSAKRYQVARGLNISLHPPQIRVTSGGSEIALPFKLLHLLEQFKQPTTFAAALAAVSGGAPSAEWIQLSGHLIQLVKIGALVDADRIERGTMLPSRSTVELHLLLLNDIYRTQQYFEALRQIVNPNDVVLDIGTGSGVLALGAAQAGARHVYAVEGNPIAQTARQLFAHNGLSERITVIEDWSTRIDLPERADVLVSEIIGNGVFGQNLIESTADARRLLKPNAKLIPNRVRLYASPVQLAEDFLTQWRMTPEQIARWGTQYHADFTPLYALDTRLAPTASIESQADAAAVTFLGDPVLLLDLDLATIQPQAIQVQKSLNIGAAGRLHGALLHFELDLAPGITLNTHPQQDPRPICWANPVWLRPAVDVHPNDVYSITLQHPAPLKLNYSIKW